MVQFKSFFAFTIAAIAIALGLVQVSHAKMVTVTVAPPIPTRAPSTRVTSTLHLGNGGQIPPSEADQKDAKRKAYDHSKMVNGPLANQLVKQQLAQNAKNLPKNSQVRESYNHDERNI